jgi:glutamate carboxypeptidase
MGKQEGKAMQCEQLFQTIETLYAQYLTVWEDACSIESPTDNKAGVDAVGRYFVALAEKHGWQVEKLELEHAGDPVCITMNPDAAAPAVVFSGHIDTVHPLGLFGTPVVRREGDRICGPGVTDCKGGVVAAFLAMDALAQCGFDTRPVRLIIQTDEETGSKNSGKKTVSFMQEKARGAVAFLNTECGDGKSAIVSRKGILRYRFDVFGKAAHSSRCNEGASAIVEAAHKILKLEMLKDVSSLTCNCGVIRGGTTGNTVAAECSFTADFRFSNPQQQAEAIHLANELAETAWIPGCTCNLVLESSRPAMPLTQRNLALLERINGIYETNGLPQLAVRHGSGGSDAAYITEAGIPCLDNLGVDGGGIHSEKEYALLPSLAMAAKQLAAVAYCI